MGRNFEIRIVAGSFEKLTPLFASLPSTMYILYGGLIDALIITTVIARWLHFWFES